MANPHGEPFPLPVPAVSSRGDMGIRPRAIGHALRQHQCHQQRVQNSCRLLNRLSSDTVRSGSAAVEAVAAGQGVSASQKSVIAHVGACVSAYGPRPPGLSRQGCLLDLLRTTDFYSGRPSSVADFDPAKLRILERKPVPRRIADVAPAFVAERLSDPDRYIRRSEKDVEAVCEGTSPIRPYWDTTLARDRTARISFIKLLAALGLVSFRRRIRAHVGLFFVSKKGGQIRVVVDAREPT